MYYFIYFIFKALVLLSEMLAQGPIHQIGRDAVLVERAGVCLQWGFTLPYMSPLKTLRALSIV